MKKTIACFAAYGSGGLGQHFKQIIDTAKSKDQLAQYYSYGIQADDPFGTIIQAPLKSILRYPPLRYSPGWISYLSCELFDSAVAQKLKQADLNSFETFQGFVGQSLRSFQTLRKVGDTQLVLEAANSHVHNLARQHKRAIQSYGIEQSWLNHAQIEKTLREYMMADIIYVASEYTRQSFLKAGFPADRLAIRTLHANPRFTLPNEQPNDGIFRVVYTGSLTVMKGIPVLLEAFSHLPSKNTELYLVGRWTTRGMKKYLRSWLSRDSRIRITPGDPLPHLQRASVYVHPTYEDGFGYAVAEALACGVPTLVTEDTGAKEYIKTGENGFIFPTGDWKSLFDYLMHFHDNR